MCWHHIFYHMLQHVLCNCTNYEIYWDSQYGCMGMVPDTFTVLFNLWCFTNSFNFILLMFIFTLQMDCHVTEQFYLIWVQNKSESTLPQYSTHTVGILNTDVSSVFSFCFACAQLLIAIMSVATITIFAIGNYFKHKII